MPPTPGTAPMKVPMPEPTSMVDQLRSTARMPDDMRWILNSAAPLAIEPPCTARSIICEIANRPISAGTSLMPSHSASTP